MKNLLVSTVDAARCRTFRLVHSDAPRKPWLLEEVSDLVHPEMRLRQSDRYSGSTPIGVRTGRSGAGHTFDDHRGAHDQHELRRFVARAAAEIDVRASEYDVEGLVISASHSVWPALREQLGQRRKLEKVRWIGAELTGLSPHQLLDDLNRRGALS